MLTHPAQREAVLGPGGWPVAIPIASLLSHPRAQARGQFQSLTPTALLDYTAGAEVEVELLVRTTATL